jgi:putative membrane protein
MHPYYWHMGWMWLFWILVIVAIVWFARSVAASGRGPSQPRETPEDILKRRYASGEISQEEFERKLAGLRR